jgi:DNA-binding HxlR family transcriptional regulator
MSHPPRSRRPVMRVLDVLGRRWALRALWELRHGPRTFRALREACDDVSPSSLNQRLAELRALGVVALGEAGYQLTPSGARLSRILIDLCRWADVVLGDPRTAKRPRRPPARTAARRSVHPASPKSQRVSRRQTQRRRPVLPRRRR